MASTHTSAAASSTMPTKTRDIHNHHMDSTVWDDLKFRPDDIIISTFPKAGTTWTQQITCQLLHAGDEKVAPNALSPWVELRVVPRAQMLQMLEAQESRRFMKTHLPIDALVFNPKAKYIFCGRNGRDSMWSWHNHLFAATDMFYQLFNDNPGRVGPALRRPSDDPRDMFMQLLQDEMDPELGWQFWGHILGWWEVRSLPNVLLIHYNDLKADLDGEMRRIAKFLEIPEMSPEQWKAAVEHCTFDWMKAHADLAAPQQAEMAWKEGAASFIHKGTNGRWKDILSEDDNRRYLERARKELGEECAQWLENGRLQGAVKLD
ncbi:P-loop containing nucleoside triphosphate hydrolase protein [Xylaria bambusicola]|uniref:P-loop containing nucleoside triphosphate hydrolase protein n=1 Tax=Xylaria bambusicola TaxID=326684 RepID=UPI002007F236|nr:P-loop containing nucleoside triphosphate hydrolase protein [Xylaria bambusicola]KAI0512498.1 P-loop containing nucleoside triphosphate hydrolase protein [Xylaria bambusicola]